VSSPTAPNPLGLRKMEKAMKWDHPFHLIMLVAALATIAEVLHHW